MYTKARHQNNHTLTAWALWRRHFPTAKGPAEAASLLGAMAADPLHVYLESLPSPVAKDCRGAFGGILGSRQVTDAYLLTLARRNHAIFVTFDTKLEGLADPETRIRVLT